MLPDDVRIRNIAPQFQKNGLVHLELACDSKTADAYLRTLTRLISSPYFADAFPRNVTAVESGGFTFVIGVEYKPSIARVVEK